MGPNLNALDYSMSQSVEMSRKKWNVEYNSSNKLARTIPYWQGESV
jgi:hypothetical protein